MRNYPSDTLITKVKSLIFRFSIYQIILSISHVNIREPQLDDDVKQQLSELQEKGIDINNLIRQMLSKRESELEERKEKAGEQAKPANSRYISVTVRKILHEEYGDKCSITGCKRPSAQIHHTQRFALSAVHDPHYLAPMCAEHHKIAHSIDVKFQSARQMAVRGG